jgi:hypothetical protein
MSQLFTHIYETWQRFSTQQSKDEEEKQRQLVAKTDADIDALAQKYDKQNQELEKPSLGKFLKDLGKEYDEDNAFKRKAMPAMETKPGIYFRASNFMEAWDASNHYENTPKGKYHVDESWQAPWFFYVDNDSITVYWYVKEWRDKLKVTDEERYNATSQLNNKDIEEWASDFEIGEGRRILVRTGFKDSSKKTKYVAFENDRISGVGIEGALAALEDEVVRRKKLIGYEKAELKMYAKRQISKELWDSVEGLKIAEQTIGMSLFDISGPVNWNESW